MLTFKWRGTTRLEPSHQVWDARDLESRSTWKQELPDDVGEEFLRLCWQNPEQASDLEAYEFDAGVLPKLAAFARKVRRNLVLGDGIHLLKGLHQLALTAEEQRLFYVAFGRAMGTPMLQYGLLYEVRDRGLSYKDQAIPVSHTGSETGFHTDSSARNTVPDFVGLLCEQPSLRGGESLVSNALQVHTLLRRHAPRALEILYRNFVRDIVTPGTERDRSNLRRNRIPVFARSRRREGILFRYMRFWIEKGQAKAGEPLTDQELGALDILDELISAPEQVVRFHLEAGDVLWVNNRTLAHNRSEFQDTPENMRLLHRMWLKAA